MVYRNKEACLAEAERLGIDASGMSWPELQRAVGNALKLEEMGMPATEQAPAEMGPAPKERSKLQLEREALKPYLGKTVLLSPELSPERYRLVKYDEVLGNEIDVEDRRFDIDPSTDMVFDVSGGKVDYDHVVDQYHDYTTGTFRIKNRSDRKVVAMSSVPKENSGMFYRPGIDYATVVSWRGRYGYLWKHWRYPNVKALLMESGYYEDYKDRFRDEPNVWYAAGKQLVCSIPLVHKTLKEIEQRARKEKKEEMAMWKELGIW